MAEERKNVERIQTATRNEASNQLGVKMIGIVDDDNPSLAAKKSNGNLEYFTAEGGDATFESMNVTGLGGSGEKYVGVDDNGNFIKKDGSSGGDVEGLEDKKPYTNGFLDQDAPTITISVVSGNPQVVVSADTVDVVYYSNGIRFTIPLGESRTYLGSNVAEGMDWWVGFDDSGVLTLVETPSQIKVYCAVALFGWNADDNAYIFSLAQPHGANMATSTHENLHFTRGSAVAKGAANLKLDGFTFGDGSDNSHFQYSRLEGVYYDEDIKVEIPASIGWSPVFYELPNGNVRFQIQGTPTGEADSGILNAPSGRPYYNPDGLGLVEVPDEEYFLMFHYGIKGTTVNDVAVMGKVSYKTIGDARIACKLEGLRFNEEWAILREMVQLGVLIYKASDEFTNDYKAALVQYSTALDGNAIDYFDSRNVAYMELPPVRVEESSEFEYVGDYTFSQYSAYYAACAVNTSATPADFVTATTLTMSEFATGGSNISATLDEITAGDSIKWTKANGDYVIMAITTAPTIAAAIYTFPCEYVEHVGDFVNSDAVGFSRSISVASMSSDNVVDDSNLTTGSVTDALELLGSRGLQEITDEGNTTTNDMIISESTEVNTTYGQGATVLRKGAFGDIPEGVSYGFSSFNCTGLYNGVTPLGNYSWIGEDSLGDFKFEVGRNSPSSSSGWVFKVDSSGLLASMNSASPQPFPLLCNKGFEITSLHSLGTISSNATETEIDALGDVAITNAAYNKDNYLTYRGTSTVTDFEDASYLEMGMHITPTSSSMTNLPSLLVGKTGRFSITTYVTGAYIRQEVTDVRYNTITIVRSFLATEMATAVWVEMARV